MNIKALLTATLVSIGIFVVFTHLGAKLAMEYLYSSVADLNFSAAKDAPNIIKLATYAGIALGTFYAIGFANRNHEATWAKGIYALFVSAPVITLAINPDLGSVRFDSDTTLSLIYFSVAAAVGSFFGLRFNRMQNI